MVTELPTQLLNATPTGRTVAGSLQTRAWDMLGGVTLPTHQSEEWRYIPMRLLSEITWQEPVAATVSAADLLDIPVASQAESLAVIVNGTFRADLSHGLEGLAVEGLAAAISMGKADKLGQLADLDTTSFEVAAHHGVLRKPGIDLFARLNTATFTDGVYCRLEKDAQVAAPIVFLFLTTGSATRVSPRVYFVAESGAEATIVEVHATLGSEPTLSLPVTEAWIAPNAKIEYVKLQIEGPAARHIALTEVEQSGDCTFKHYNVSYGSLLTRNDVNCAIIGQNAHTRLDGVTCIAGEQLVDNHTRLDHAMPNCESFEAYKHLLDGKSTAVFNGKIFVYQDAQKTDAKQTNQTVLLSPTATMNTKPQLEIFADDVKCTHGATVGHLETSMQFYLQSRGIPASEARALLVYAFAAEVLDQIESEPVREELESLLFAKLRQS
ncbi:MAG: Fe-S cluster assembly protein SufD [Chthonomonas sp.]|nr:Fe-S cluster assembly protein SufD [Chthonomonas sp.]